MSDLNSHVESVAQKRCPLCSFEAPAISYILSHLRTVHSSDPRFQATCGIGGCAVTSKTFSALYSHIYHRHPEIIKRRKDSEQTSQTCDQQAPLAGNEDIDQEAQKYDENPLEAAGIKDLASYML